MIRLALLLPLLAITSWVPAIAPVARPLVAVRTRRPLAARLTELTGTTQYRQNIGEWLHPDPDKRIEPRLGMGLLLLDTFNKEFNGASNGPTTTRAPRRSRVPRKSRTARKPRGPRVPRKKVSKLKK